MPFALTVSEFRTFKYFLRHFASINKHKITFECVASGFTVEFERVKNLPCGETQTFTVKFDAQGSSVRMGDISVVMPIQVVAGTLTHQRI